MNIKQMKDSIKICMKAGAPLMIWGPGGVGKSEGIEQLAEELGIQYRCIEAPTRDPIDIVGYPAEEGKYMVWRRPSILPETGKGIFHVDELPDATQMLMKALYHLILKGEVAGHKIGDSWYRIGSGNRPQDGGFSSDMPAPLITRFIHIGVCCETPDFTEQTPKTAQVDIEDWTSWALSKLHSYTIAFLNFRPDFIYHHQATPRTWEYVSKLLKSTEDHHSFIFGELVKGTIGQGPGMEFMTFLKLITKIPSIDAIIADPIHGIIPKENSLLYAVVTSLIQRLNKKTADNIIKYINRITTEYQFYFFRSAIQIHPELLSNGLYIDWINKNEEYLK